MPSEAPSSDPKVTATASSAVAQSAAASDGIEVIPPAGTGPLARFKRGQHSPEEPPQLPAPAVENPPASPLAVIASVGPSQPQPTEVPRGDRPPHGRGDRPKSRRDKEREKDKQLER